MSGHLLIAAFTTCASYNTRVMEPSRALLAQLEWEDIEQARRMTPNQKLRAGGDLFDEACRWTLAGIRNDHPGIAPEAAMAELRRRLAMEDKATGRR